MKADTQKLWKEALSSIKVSLSPATFSTWFSQTFIVSLARLGTRRNLVEVGCPSSFVADTLEKRYFGLIQDSLNSVTGQKNDLRFIVKQNPRATKPAPSPLFSLPEKETLEEDAVLLFKKAGLRPGFTFENFAVSSTNQMAHAAAEAAAKNPGHAYNPLLFWGGVGVGKTHLALALGHRVVEEAPQKAAFYCTAEEFTTGIIEAIKNRDTASFKRRYRTLGLLLLDDVQFLAGKTAVQEEFFHTFNAIQKEGGQIVLTSDRPPAEIERLEERLRSRFEAGLIVDIAPPDFELLTAIALIKAKERGVELPMDVAQALAANLSSARQVEGFLIRLLAAGQTKKEALSVETVTRLLGKNGASSTLGLRAVSPQDVIAAVARYFSLGRRGLLGQSRRRSLSVPRQVLMYLLRAELGLPLAEVGRLIGGRDHTTIMHGVTKVSHLLAKNQTFARDVLGIKRTLEGAP